MFIYDVVARSAALWPDAPAVSDDATTLTFEELRRATARLARGLRELGLQPGQRVVDLQTNAVSYVLTDLAIPSAGLVRVAVNYRLTVAELAYIVDDSGASAIVYGDGFQDVAAELMRRCPRLRIAIGVADDALGHSIAGVSARAGDGPVPGPTQPAELVSLNYSSGTTGRPKGCMRTARNRYTSTCDILLSVLGEGFGPRDVVLHAGPITHASGLFVLPALVAGAKQILMSRFDAREVLRLLQEGGATCTVMVPTMLERVMAEAGDEPRDFPTLRAVIYAGAPMPVERIKLARRIFAGRLVQFYGMVEAIPPVTVLDVEAHADDSLLSSAGRAPLGVRLEVVSPSGGRCAPNELGEVLVGGDHVMSGYWGKDHQDGKVFKNGLLRTGDIGRLDERGYLHLVDRAGDMIITGGYNVYPREVEDVIRSFDGVADVAVVGVPDADWGQAVTAFVVEDGEGPVDVPGLLDWCAERLAAFKKPKAVQLVADLPKTALGKIDRKALVP